jgi:protein-L-isoaspartate(D-aspartate) O-methyltransferase
MPDHGVLDGLREQLVDRLCAAGVLRDDRVVQALRVVPRHLFLPEVEPERTYRDEAIVTKRSPEGWSISSSSQPTVMAVMLEQLDVGCGQRVLEIGAGTGYNAALLTHLVGETGEVTTIDIDEDLAEQARRNLAVVDVRGVSVVCADGAAGWPDGAPYDRIILTVGAWDLAPAWVVQLSAGGRLLVPLSLRSVQRTVAFEQAGDHLTSVSVAPCGFMPLRGQMAKPESVRPLRAGSGLFVNFDGECRLDTAALYTALGYPAELLTTGIRVTPAELFDGLALWLALHEPDSGRLFAVGAAADLGLVPPLLPGMTSTYVLLEEQAMAALVCLDQQLDSGTSSSAFELGVRVFGAAGHDLAQQLVGTIHQWHASGRRATAGLRIRAYPRASNTDGDTAAVIDKHYSRLLLDWPEQSSRFT